MPAQLKQHIPEQYLSRDFEIQVNFSHGPQLKGASLQGWLEQRRYRTESILPAKRNSSSNTFCCGKPTTGGIAPHSAICEPPTAYLRE